jgi:predicted enzyme related to lactoylglutathione lyase
MKPQPGTFCWIELGTTDVKKAKAFYKGLFGWTFNDIPMGDGEDYTFLQLKKKGVGGFYPLPLGKKAGKLPVFWLPYILVENVARTVARIEKAGGTLFKGPMQVMDMGEMAILQDPTGATFALWQPLQKGQPTAERVPGAVYWHDLNTPDPKKAAAFYAKIFGWKQVNQDYGGNAYYLQTLGGKGIGGIWPHMAKGSKPSWVTHWGVTDCAKTTAKVKKLGGRVIMGPIAVPGAAIFSLLQDPQGAVLGIIEPRGSAI